MKNESEEIVVPRVAKKENPAKTEYAETYSSPKRRRRRGAGVVTQGQKIDLPFYFLKEDWRKREFRDKVIETIVRTLVYAKVRRRSVASPLRVDLHHEEWACASMSMGAQAWAKGDRAVRELVDTTLDKDRLFVTSKSGTVKGRRVAEEANFRGAGGAAPTEEGLILVDLHAMELRPMWAHYYAECRGP